MQEDMSNMKKVSGLPSRVETLYECDGDEEDELSFVAGEIIAVTGKLEILLLSLLVRRRLLFLNCTFAQFFFTNFRD